MLKKLKDLGISRIVIAVLVIILGIVFIVIPDGSADVMCMVAGIVFVVCGVALGVKFFITAPFFGDYSLIGSIISLAIGIAFLVIPGTMKGILTILFGAFVIIDGSLSVSQAITCGRVHIRGWWVMLLLSIISIAFGVCTMFGVYGSDILMLFLGISLIVDGADDLILSIFFSKKISEAQKVLKQAEKQVIDVEESK